MTNNTITIPEEVLELYVAADIASYCYMSCLALYTYDFCINLRREINFIRRRSLSVAAALFVLLHISTFWSVVLYVALPWVENCESGYDMNVAYGVFLVLLQSAITAIGTLRVYAINGRRWLFPTTVFVLQVPALVEDIYFCATLSLSFEIAPGSSCAVIGTNVQASMRLDIVAVVTVWISNVLVLMFTWRSTHGIRAPMNANGMRLSLASLVLRDGTIYFGTTLFLTSLNIAALFAGQSLTGLKAFSSVFLTITLSRMLLNLREVSPATDSTTGSSSQMMSTNVRLSRDMASLSGSVANEWDQNDDDDDFIDDGPVEEHDDGPRAGRSDPEDVQDVRGMCNACGTPEMVDIEREGSAALCH